MNYFQFEARMFAIALSLMYTLREKSQGSTSSSQLVEVRAIASFPLIKFDIIPNNLG
ncbi:MAG: hypothetical protein LDL41_21505 [Coleofasciculus sp. S288]|nr:hypothetical protein [Coleofasciculus sp. S288]